ncbi:5-formyltetrahydrofolate cyclo-ligase [Altericroceibacterium endophyticum]|uniref:5-formyltetrahydrofolate cyclo-ligase n=1 Tax=Altericroceibacterium endophyticum TaxID=1808508 RepID=A0A6I4T168_9SPHN|nr:5-formyltetrahydrofolate cyclo-ligase [Altericroceibacterium endophyticum]MXO64666.1 5-formyltetrahydrofolate cyclo-ligase [Altericroceibacterium endophyticum]
MSASPKDRKQALRKELREARKAHDAALPTSIRALILNRPPAPLLDLVPEGATIGLYVAVAGEAPTAGYARYFYDQGHPLALPAFTDRSAPMEFRSWDNPYVEEALEEGPFGPQPSGDQPIVVPDILITPLVGFTERGERMGQGAGHYDTWLQSHPQVTTIGLAWDIQKVDMLPLEPHDVPLTAIVTPSRFYGPF